MINFIEKIKKKNLFVSEDFTYQDYVNQLVQLQTLICQEVFKDDYNKKFRINDAMSTVKCYSISHNIANSDTYYKGIKALQQIEKELAISFSGKKAESYVDHLLRKYVSRDDFTNYKGIYLNNGSENTEIDNLILTKNGFLLLEVKNIKTDVKISEEGRLFVDNDCSYEQVPLAEKMERKRNLFKSEIKKLLKKKGVHIDIELQSFIVFNEPKGKNYYVTNLSNEKWCKSNQLAYKVNELNSIIPYSDEQLNLLRECCEEFETHQKTFVLNYDIESTLNDICGLMDLFNTSKEKENKTDPAKKEKKIKMFKNLFKPVFPGFPTLSTGLYLIAISLISSSVISNRITKY